MAVNNLSTYATEFDPECVGFYCGRLSRQIPYGVDHLERGETSTFAIEDVVRRLPAHLMSQLEGEGGIFIRSVLATKRLVAESASSGVASATQVSGAGAAASSGVASSAGAGAGAAEAKTPDLVRIQKSKATTVSRPRAGSARAALRAAHARMVAFPLLHLAEVPADGNCLFSSIAMLLCCVFSGTYTHASVREAICNYMHDNQATILSAMDARGRSEMSTISDCIRLEMHDCPRPKKWKGEWPPLVAEVRNTTA